jgi:steroid delta-isomerase-like uncharacterized protein
MTETETLVRRYYDAFNAADVEGMLACLSEDVRHDVNQGETRHGKAAFATFCAHMAKCYREKLTDMVFLFDATGTRAAVEFVVNGSYLATDPGLPEAKGQTYVLPAGAFLAIDNGRITRVTTYYNLPEWERQVLGT